jgi:ribulose-5-phosphate 4-epimerase/fuculose-1-phosphate aldolase
MREWIALHGESLHQRGLVPGSSGNISVRLDDGYLVSPTNSCLGRLDPARIARLDADGNLLAGDPASKEAFLHTQMYAVRPNDTAVVHLHSTHAVAVSCMGGLDEDNVLPPYTSYYVMKIGRLPLVPWFRPGDPALAMAVREYAEQRHAMLLANHGPVVSGKDLDWAVNAIEELEETARLHLLLDGKSLRLLNAAQLAELNEHFPS